MSYHAELQRKLISADGAAALVQSGDWVDYGFGVGQPDLFDQALAARKSNLRGVNIRSAFSLRPRAVLEADTEGEHFGWFSWHFSGLDRIWHDANRCNYVPMNFGEAPDFYRRFVDGVNVVCLKTTPMDEHGYFNFGGSVTYHRALCERAHKIIVEPCPSMPYVYGAQQDVHLSQVTHVIDEDSPAVPEIAISPITEIDRKVAALVTAEIESGACLQIGIGGMPNAICALLAESDVKELGVHTELLVDGMIDLFQAGKISGARKALNRNQIIFTFVAGTRRVYDFINRNPGAQSFPVDYTNLPHNIMQNDNVISINSTTQIDLQGQSASESVGHRHVSGTGGQLQFVRGAYASRGGKSFICLSSVYDKKGRRESRIVSTLTPGNIITTPRTDIMYVVTEYGLVNLKGRSVAERARALISIAHPDFRETLEREARMNNLIPKGFF